MVNDLLIQQGARLRDALRQLEETERKTLFVVDERDCLLGTLTDGDVRRWILSGGDLDGSVGRVCNKDPFVVRDQYDPAEIRQQMLQQQISCIPIVDADGRVSEALFWDVVFGQDSTPPVTPKLDLPVVIMAGGKGTRMAPFTHVLPKPLIPIGDKTVIELIVDSFTAYGMTEFTLSVNFKSKIIRSYFEELDPSYQVNYIYEDMPLGTAGSLSQLAGMLDRDLFVTNCDVIIRADYHGLLRHHKEQDNDVTLVVSLKSYSIPYGVCEIDNTGRLDQILEKPEYNFLVNTGLYLLKPDVLDLIPREQVFHITDLIERIQADGGKVGVYPISEGAWLDTGEWEEYRRAARHLGVLASPESTD